MTRGRDAHERILAAFLAREADILIGTQMVAKGLDLPAVTLVGVVNADIGLHLPDFRAGERTFQLLTQVAGRAGPRRAAGPRDHPDLHARPLRDRRGSALRLRRLRRGRAGGARSGAATRRSRGSCGSSFSHTNPRSARDEALRLQRALSQRRAELGSDVDVVGPSPAYVPRVRGRWRWQFLLRGRDPAALVRDFLLPPDWAVDVDPASLGVS